jgi:TonB family protein
MKEHSIAVSVSLLFHIIIVAIFLRVPFDQYIKPKLMVLDFSLQKGRLTDDTAQSNLVEGGKTVTRKSEIVNRESKIENRKSQQKEQMTDYRNRTIEQAHNVQNNSALEPLSMKQSGLGSAASDPADQITVRGETGPVVAKADDASGKHVSVGGYPHNLFPTAGGGRTVDYGKDGSGAKDFPFINDTLRKQFKNMYPDRALRMGWEGRVLLSFVISENGTVNDVEIVNSSGRHIFDDHAREILKKTTFNKKLPYSLKINNYLVSYQLQQ